MYSILTSYCKFNIVPFNYRNRYIDHPKIYDNGNWHTDRYLRLLIFLGAKEITIHSRCYENKEGFAYCLHLLFNGCYAINFTEKNLKLLN